MFAKLTINNEPLNGFKLKRGDDYEITLIIFQPAQTGASIQFIAKPSIDDPDSAAIFSKASPASVTATVTDTILTATWAISGSETQPLAGGTKLIYGVQRVLNGKVATIEEGSFEITADVVLFQP